MAVQDPPRAAASPEPGDDTLLQRFQASKDAKALETLFARHASCAFRVAQRVTENEADAEEAVQQAFLEILRGAARTSQASSVRTWLVGIVLNQARKKVREEQRRRKREEAAVMMRASETQTSDLETQRAAQAFARKLPELYRLPVWMHYFEGMTFREIAEALGTQEGTVKSQASRGLDELRGALGAAGYTLAGPALLGVLAAAQLPAAPATLFAGLSTLAAGAASAGVGATVGSSAAGAKAAAGIGGMAMKITLAAVVLTATGAATFVATRTDSADVPAKKTAGPAAETKDNAAPKGNDKAALGALDFFPSPAHPIGWRGDYTGRYPGATPPTVWSRRLKAVTTEMYCQAGKPSGNEPTKDSHPLEYFTIKDWLVAGPFSVDDPVKDIAADQLGGEATAMPEDGGKAGPVTWKAVHAGIENQSRHDHNEGTCGNLNVDFLFTFGKFTTEKLNSVKLEGDFANKIAYVHTYLYAPSDSKVHLALPFAGSSGKFWLNGKPTDLDPKNAGKGFDVALVKGWNRLLVKIGTANGLGINYDKRWFSHWYVSGYVTPPGPYAYETKNVAWMTKLTGRSMSAPIVVGDRIFLGSSMTDLLCISKTDGKVLWLHSNTPYDTFTDADKTANPELKAKIEPLAAKLDALNEDAVKAINAAVAPQGMASEQTAQVDAKLKLKNEAERALHAAIAGLDKKKYPAMYENEVSASDPTPCSDGTYVYWACGGGMKGPGANVLSAFDLSGKRVWSVHLNLGSEEHGNHSSTTLLDGKLIYQAHHTVLALDAKTGKELWRNDKGDWLTATSALTLVPTRLGNTPAVIGRKFVYSALDGSVICEAKFDPWGDLSPIVENGVIYNAACWQGWEAPNTFIAIKLPASADKGAKAEVAWKPDGREVSTPTRGLTYTIASPLYVDGVVYAADITGGLMVTDVNAKKSLYRLWLDGYNRYNRYLYGIAASPTLGGKNIYIVDDAGFTHILQPGPAFKEVGRNVLENIHLSSYSGNPCKQECFYTSPVFEGKSMYLRGEEYLYCIAEK
ncbi:MAG: sigma-70 family RNA polymerase sigma factor [Planctomycetes bacterium]|nr:sigma-70 family RNA polymerase sigma factor [Planctomycetota bacterium]